MNKKNYIDFMAVGKNKFLYHPWRFLSKRAYILTSKQRDEIMDFQSHAVLILMLGTTFFLAKKRHHAQDLNFHNLMCCIGFFYYLIAFFYLSIRRHYIFKKCEAIRCERYNFSHYMKQLAPSRKITTIAICILFFLSVSILDLFVFRKFFSSESLDIGLLALAIFTGFLAFPTLIFFLIMMKYKLQNKYKLRRKDNIICNKK
ncbi:hypothetical protein Lgee_0703 [Legionella geestiana]|uniref:Uncharacterized protein n=1 Tax=Legionella geestiana TaxID=45065 RepID=A0A0W0U3S8_9GAMM|nr:hypothetical protein [Legionella geestiana]KTD02374.1 hypothetical protein Lgee_0703 [Legionella geestiana]QBS12152.1 hypothetical protein E4T54_05015 [Legionella geestiana]STX53120.1 Uncharacterised protein [Legionella geestiana]